LSQPHIAVEARHDFSGDEIAALEDRFDEFNGNQTGHRDARQLGFEIKADDELIGAVAGWTWAGIGELRQVWVKDSFRGKGLGTLLLCLAINEARGRGCSHLFVATYSFQAPDFYQRFGFETVAVIEDRPPGHRDFIMRLTLQ